jgi:hypothetical protein
MNAIAETEREFKAALENWSKLKAALPASVNPGAPPRPEEFESSSDEE